MTGPRDQTFALVDLAQTASIDAARLASHIEGELTGSNFDVSCVDVYDGVGFSLTSAQHILGVYLEQGDTSRFVIEVVDVAAVNENDADNKNRLVLCSATVLCILAAVEADRVQLFHNGIKRDTGNLIEYLHSARPRRDAGRILPMRVRQSAARGRDARPVAQFA